LWRILEKLPFGIPCEDPPGRRVIPRAGRARDGHDPRGREEHPPPTPWGLIMLLGVLLLLRIVRILRYGTLRLRSPGAYLLFRPPPCAGTFIIATEAGEKQTETVDGRD